MGVITTTTKSVDIQVNYFKFHSNKSEEVIQIITRKNRHIQSLGIWIASDFSTVILEAGRQCLHA